MVEPFCHCPFNDFAVFPAIPEHGLFHTTLLVNQHRR
jgi:hypothetical protein